MSVLIVYVFVVGVVVFFFKQKTAYELRISDWSSDVCSSDLPGYLFALSFPTDQPDPRVRLPDSVPAAGSLRFSPKRHLAPAFRYALHEYSAKLRIRGAHAPGHNRQIGRAHV